MIRKLTSRRRSSLWSNFLLTEYYNRRYSNGDKPEGAVHINGKPLTSFSQLVGASEKYRLIQKVPIQVAFIIMAMAISTMLLKGFSLFPWQIFLFGLALCIVSVIFRVLSYEADQKSVDDEIEKACHHLMILYRIANNDPDMLSWKLWLKTYPEQGDRIRFMKDVSLEQKISSIAGNLQAFDFYCSKYDDEFLVDRCKDMIHTLAVIMFRFGFKAQFEAPEAQAVEQDAWRRLNRLVHDLSARHKYMARGPDSDGIKAPA